MYTAGADKTRRPLFICGGTFTACLFVCRLCERLSLMWCACWVLTVRWPKFAFVLRRNNEFAFASFLRVWINCIYVQRGAYVPLYENENRAYGLDCRHSSNVIKWHDHWKSVFSLNFYDDFVFLNIIELVWGKINSLLRKTFAIQKIVKSVTGKDIFVTKMNAKCLIMIQEALSRSQFFAPHFFSLNYHYQREWKLVNLCCAKYLRHALYDSINTFWKLSKCCRTFYTFLNLVEIAFFDNNNPGVEPIYNNANE